MTAKLKFTPKYDKIVEALLYLAHKTPHIDHYQAVKLLYLADKEHLNKYGRPITYERYYALQYGPVASNALNLLKNENSALRKCNIESLPFKTEKLDNIIYIKHPQRSVNHDLFSISDLKSLDKIINKYSKYSFKQLYDITHEHFAYKTAWENRGTKKNAEIKYEDMLDESPSKAEYIEEIATISDHMQ